MDMSLVKLIHRRKPICDIPTLGIGNLFGSKRTSFSSEALSIAGGGSGEVDHFRIVTMYQMCRPDGPPEGPMPIVVVQ